MYKVNFTLLVDDDNISNFINKRLIQKLGISDEIKVALNGEEALKIIEEEYTQHHVCPDLIFLDVNMPVMNGLEFIEAFRSVNICGNQKLPIVMLTTSTNPRDLDELKKLGMNWLIDKPLTEAKLLQVLETISHAQENS